MQIHLISVGQKMPSWVKQGYEEYAKRMPRECELILKEIPADFIATNSDFSPNAPKVITEAKSMEIGRARGTNRIEAKNNSSPISFISSPFPTKSSIHFHKNCIKSRKIAIKKVAINGPKKDLIMKRCSFFIQKILKI